MATKVTFSGLNSATNYVRLIPKIAPTGSELAKSIEAAERSGATPASVFEGVSTGEWPTKFDKGGVYTFSLVEETRQSSSSRFDGDTYGAAQPSIVATSDVTLHVGTKLTLQLGQQPNTATLTVYGWNDTVYATTIGEHGIETPAIDGATSPEALAAANSAGVVAAAEALAGQTYTAILGNLESSFWSPLVTDFNTHVGSTTRHTDADIYSPIGTEITVLSVQGREKAVSELGRLLRNHMGLTDTVDTDSPPSDITIHAQADSRNLPLLGGAGRRVSEQYAALADLALAFADHVNTDGAVHIGTPSTITIGTTPLFSAHLEFMRSIRSAAPTVPPEVSGVAVYLTTFGGFLAP